MKTNKQSGFGLVEALMIVAVIALLAVVGWSIFSNMNKEKATDKQNSTQARVQQENKIIDAEKGSPELVAFLKAEYSGCDKLVDRPATRATYKIIAEVPGFAKLGYGCNETKAFAIAKNVSGKWELISPTNEFTTDGIPSCKMVDEHKIPQRLMSQCSIEPLIPKANEQSNLRAVTY